MPGKIDKAVPFFLEMESLVKLTRDQSNPKQEVSITNADRILLYTI